MVTKFYPEANKVYNINHNTLYHILEGSGGIQVDFKNYLDWEDKLIFLETGQYIKFLSDSFEVRRIDFQDDTFFNNEDVRVLFKHLVSLGYINYQECDDCQKYLSDTLFSSPKDIVDVSVHQWFWQNPFNADHDEYQIIFDLKEVIDSEFKNQPTVESLLDVIGHNNRTVHNLVRNKVGLSVKNLFNNKKLLESKREVAFSDKPINHIAYDHGYSDPAYYNRVFKKTTGISPSQFRDQIGYELEDVFEQQLFDLIKEYHQQEHRLSFYAQQLHLSEKTLSKKVRQKLNTSLGHLLKAELIKSAKTYLSQGIKVKDTAFALGFEEANHFSTFFKHYTQLTPTDYLAKKSKK